MSAGSGIAPSTESLQIVDELRRHNTKLVFALFKIQGIEVVPDVVYPTTEDEVAEVQQLKKSDAEYASQFKSTVYPKFIKAIEAADGPRYGLIDFAYPTDDGRIVKNLAIISVCFDRTTPAKTKMVFASTKTALEMKFNIGKKYTANDPSELEYNTVFDYIKSAH